MNVLVTAATRHGATMEIAVAIGRTLEQEGYEADVRALDEVGEIDGYDAVVLGSAVYVGRWLDTARRFVTDRAPELAAKPLWLFSSGPIGAPLKPEPGKAVDVDEIAEVTQARGHVLFAGKVDRSRLGFGERAVLRAVRAPEGDFRDWEAVEEWTHRLCAELSTLPLARASASTPSR